MNELPSDGQAILEELLDAYGMTALLAGLSVICSEKAEHVRSNWQDEAAGKAWDKLARRICQIETRESPL